LCHFARNIVLADPRKASASSTISTNILPGPPPAASLRTAQKVVVDLILRVLEKGDCERDCAAYKRLEDRRREEQKVLSSRSADFPSLLQHSRGLSKEEKERWKQRKDRYDKVSGYITKLEEELGRSIVEMIDKPLRSARGSSHAIDGTQLERLKQQNDQLRTEVTSCRDDVVKFEKRLYDQESATTRLMADNEKKICELVTSMQAAKADNDKLREELKAGKSENEQLREKLETSMLTAKTANDRVKGELQASKSEAAKQSAIIESLVEAMEALREKVNRDDRANAAVRNLVDRHEDTLAEFDRDNLSVAADFFAFDKPKMETRLAQLETIVKSNAANGRALENNISAKFQERLDDLSQKHQVFERRVQAAEAMGSGKSSEVASSALGDASKALAEVRENFSASLRDSTAVLSENFAGQLATLKMEVESGLRMGLQENKSSWDAAMESLNRDVRAELNNLTMMISTIDTQVNNIMTTDVYERIVGHMEKLLPTADQQRQVQQDLDVIAAEFADWRKVRDQYTADMNNIHNMLSQVVATGDRFAATKCRLDRVNGT
jgi:predicted  nucleic acid-binding Zn-ribbon protein